MRVGIDGRMFDKYLTSVGVGRYTYNLIQNLVKVDQKNEYVVFSNAAEKIGKHIPVGPRFKIKNVNLPMFSVRNQLKFSSVLRKEEIDVFHAPYFDAPLAGGTPFIMTIHDLIHLIFPQYFNKKVRVYYQGVVKPAVRKSNKIIADSKSSKEDIVRILGVPESKVVVIYPGVEEKFRPLADSDSAHNLCQRYSLSKEIILFVGNMKPHKNLAGLMEAFARLRQDDGVDCQLVVIGEKDRHFWQIQAKVQELKLQQEVVFTGLVAEDEMPLFYNAAEVLVLPSLYEGFGLPALEAMACGTPVVCSNTSSLPEVVGDAAILFNPKSIDEMTKAISRLLGDKSLKQKMVKEGLERAKLFSWKKTVQETVEVYNQAIKGNEK